ncbi:MAG: glycosyl transferase [Cereibacter sphaeroides]|uniref:Glycosyl transferase n=1 Tax=Cereibacter sphaeroides TaxID=1063 RepID=A0A2W5S943_CERSP|nr:MAG: glycosyl transferase [Cereibacter sphaeroides]
MRIAFYAPLKSPDHPVPSGDRLMARLLMTCLRREGHLVEVVSQLRSFVGDPADEARLAELQTLAKEARHGIAAAWDKGEKPDLWFCYHPYYKAPDLIGPPLCARHKVPYVTCEASYSLRRNTGVWACMQESVREALVMAAVNICMTDRDRQGIVEALPQARVARLRPFIAEATVPAPQPEPFHLICVAMMRAGDKMKSYEHLASALEKLPDIPWRLSVIGDGPMRNEVEAAFARVPPGRVRWLGLMQPEGMASILARGALYVWPGCGEAYGLAYLEAQAAGLPVVAFDTAGVPEVVANGETGVLVPAGDDAALARAVADLLADPERRLAMAAAAQRRVMRDHSLPGATEALRRILSDAMER